MTAFNSKRKVRIIFLALAVIAIAACGRNLAEAIVGTWRLSTVECNGSPVPFSNITIETTYRANGTVESVETDLAGCGQRSVGTYVVDGGELRTSWASSECVADQCNLNFVYDGQPVSAACGTVQPTGGGGSIEVTDARLIVTEESENFRCSLTMIRTR